MMTVQYVRCLHISPANFTFISEKDSAQPQCSMFKCVLLFSKILIECFNVKCQTFHSKKRFLFVIPLTLHD